MIELEIQKKLRQGITLDQLTDTYGIKFKQSLIHPELYLFKYDQIKSPMKEQIVQECRGLILNKEDDWNIVCFPYTKFFNYGDSLAPALSSNITICKKLDGSLINLYYYKGWRFSTSGDPDAGGVCLNNSPIQVTFNDLVKDVWNNLDYSMPLKIDRYYTFMFELCTMFNKNVVQHKESSLMLHGARNITTGEELNIYTSGQMSTYNWKVCPIFDLNKLSSNSMKVIKERMNTISPLLNEGAIVVDENFNRVKIKSDAYVALHHIKGSMCPRSMLDVIRRNETSELLLHFPEFTEVFHIVNNKFRSLKNHIRVLSDYWIIKKEREELSRKEVASFFKDYCFIGLMFPLIFDDKDIDTLLLNMPIKTLEKWLTNY